MIRIFKIMYFIILCGLYFHYELYPFDIAVSNNNIIYNYIGNCDNITTKNNFNIDLNGCVDTEYKILDFFNFIKSFTNLFQTDDGIKLSSILNKDKNFKMLSYCGVDKEDEIVEKYFNVEIKSLEDVLVVSSSMVVKLIFSIDIYLPKCVNLLKSKISLKDKYPHNIVYLQKTKHYKLEDELLPEYKYSLKTKHYKSEDELLSEYKYLQEYNYKEFLKKIDKFV